jgi:integrase
VHEITRRDVLDLLDRTVDRGSPIAANRTLAAVRKLFAWCVDRDIITLSPCSGVKPPALERSRDRVLTDSELVAVWMAATDLGYPFGSLVQLLLLTAQRRDEVAGMRWTEIDLGNRLWTLPRERVKNNQPHEVPLSEAAMSLLEAVPRIAGPFVLTTNGQSPASGYSKGKRRLDTLMPASVIPWRLHDLRRTAATGMARIGIDMPVVERVLNHTSGSFGGVAGIYQRHDYRDEKAKALEAWGRLVTSLVSGRTADNVIPLKAGA